MCLYFSFADYDCVFLLLFSSVVLSPNCFCPSHATPYLTHSAWNTPFSSSQCSTLVTVNWGVSFILLVHILLYKRFHYTHTQKASRANVTSNRWQEKPVENVLKMLKMAPVAMKIIFKLVFYSCMKAIRQEIEKMYVDSMTHFGHGILSKTKQQQLPLFQKNGTLTRIQG